ncbi:MAG: hypothetical protein LUE16_00020 [Lachnospiraceae bacterium]|nr:hypothetical protein [Lachnospiraceae bacterium]
MENKRMFTTVYVCSPYRLEKQMDGEMKRTWEADVKTARMACRMLAKLGYMPLSPQLYFCRFLSSLDEMEQVDYRMLAQEWLMQADEMWLIGDILTEEMAKEVSLARSRGIPVRHLGLTEPGNLLEIVTSDMSGWRAIPG